MSDKITLDLTLKQLNKLNKEDLVELAKRLSIEVTDASTKKTLTEAILLVAEPAEEAQHQLADNEFVYKNKTYRVTARAIRFPHLKQELSAQEIACAEPELHERLVERGGVGPGCGVELV